MLQATNNVYFDDYTIYKNFSFKIKMGHYLISVTPHLDIDAFSKMIDNEILTGNSDDLVKTSPSDVPVFTFNSDNSEVCVIDLNTNNTVTSKFSNRADSYDDIIYGCNPYELTKIMTKVMEAVKEN